MAELKLLATNPPKRGYGTALMNIAMEKMRKDGYSMVQGEPAESAKEFYKVLMKRTGNDAHVNEVGRDGKFLEMDLVEPMTETKNMDLIKLTFRRKNIEINTAEHSTKKVKIACFKGTWDDDAVDLANFHYFEHTWDILSKKIRTSYRHEEWEKVRVEQQEGKNELKKTLAATKHVVNGITAEFNNLADGMAILLPKYAFVFAFNEKNRPVGCLYYETSMEDETVAHLKYVVAHPRRDGHGTAMMIAAIKEMKEDGFAQVKGTPAESAKAFYQALAEKNGMDYKNLDDHTIQAELPSVEELQKLKAKGRRRLSENSAEKLCRFERMFRG